MLAVTLTGLALAVYLWHEADDQIRRRVEARLAEHYAPLGLKVQVGSAELVRDGVQLRRVTVTDPKLAGDAGRLAEIEAIHVICDVDAGRLLHGQVSVKQIRITRPTLRAIEAADGTWNIARLFPLPKLSPLPRPPLPAVEIEAGVVEISVPVGQAYRRFRVQDVQLSMQANGPLPTGVRNVSPDRLYTMRGELAGDLLRRVRFGGWLHPDSKSWRLTGGVDSLELSNDLAALAAARYSQTRPTGEVRGQVDLDFAAWQIVSDSKRPTPVTIEVDGRVASGYVSDRRLPNPITDIAARFHWDANGLVVEQATARFGSAEIMANLKAARLDGHGPIEIAAEAKHIVAEQRWVDALPESARVVWEKFLPEGEADARFKATYDGARWTPYARVDFRDGAFTYYKFPYRMRQASGTFEWHDNQIDTNLVAYAGGHPVRITAKTINPGPNYTGWVEAAADRFDVHEELIAALPEKVARVARSLAVRGHGSFFGRFEHTDPNTTAVHHRMTLGVADAAVKYERFPLPIEGISGILTAVDNHWTWDNLRANRIRSHGEWIPHAEGGQLRMRIDAQDVALDEPLRAALPPGAQQVWRDLRPRGVVDDIHVDIDWLSAEHRLDLSIDAEKMPASVRAVYGNDGRWRSGVATERRADPTDVRQGTPSGDRGVAPSANLANTIAPSIGPSVGGAIAENLQATSGPSEAISIEPTWFPLRLEELHGRATYRNGRITLKNVQASRGRGRLTTSGTIESTSDGGFAARFEGVALQRLSLDRDLVDAAPGRLRGVLARLSLGEPVDLRGTIGFTRQGDRDHPIASDWDLTVVLQQNSIDCGVKVDNLHGEVRLVGSQAVDGVMTCLGQLDLDAATFHGVQFSRVQGPLEINDRQMLLGSKARQLFVRDGGAGQPTTRPITAQLYGGTIAADATVVFGPRPTFALQAQLSDADIKQYALEMISGRQAVSGKFYASAQLSGGEGVNTLRGQGRVRLRDADVYQLPVMLAMLKVLSVRLPDATGFTAGDIDYRIEGNHIYLDRINFKGDALSLLGKGEANFNRDVKLNFYTMVGRDDWNLPIIRPLLGEASRQMMQIRVDGTLDKPEIKQEAFPGAKQFLQQVQEDLAGSSEGQDVLGPAREVLRRVGSAPR